MRFLARVFSASPNVTRVACRCVLLVAKWAAVTHRPLLFRLCMQRHELSTRTVIGKP
jgi:hypothetical protein